MTETEIVFLADDGLWYFYDETWAGTYGPYASEFAAHLDLVHYCKFVLGV